ncbi:SDR family oxidoreductase [Candidatus Pelagibacter sp.]|nr:SDR family oxidoreductase [Candidatus Pelagibacter sp.]MDC1070455.1 SDR family oxidoreductase [Candidatus Pelagibacter sp.]
MIKNILVTGASGYIGSVLTPMLLKRGYKVYALDRFFFGDNLKNHKNLIKIYKDTRSLKNKDFKNIHAVIDLAAISNDPSGEFFKKETIDINFKARLNCAILAKKNKVKRYLLPSSCSIYGFNKNLVDEKSRINPLTTYAKANYLAEKYIMVLANKKFCVSVLRQATIFGYSPRMRYDLAINGMTEGAFTLKKIPIMRDGKQIRPLLHVKDTCRALIYFLKKDSKIINKEIFNVGSETCTVSIKQMANKVKKNINNLKLEWYGNKDTRSYNVSFNKIEKIGFKIKYDLDYGIKEIIKGLKKSKKNSKSLKTITLEWYKLLEELSPYILKSQINNKMVKKF